MATSSPPPSLRNPPVTLPAAADAGQSDNRSLPGSSWLSRSTFRDVVSGRRRGLSAGAVRLALSAAEIPYTAAVRLRNRRYDLGVARVERVGVPVLCAGNLTLGGTGKTPLVKWLARWLIDRGLRVAIVSRGYRAAANGQNDEALELEQSLPGVPHLQCADRAEGARRAIEEFAAQVIVLDDGFQHRRLARDLDIVLLDALEPFGFDRVFPRGTLREPLAGLARAGVVALSRADLIDEAERLRIRRAVEQYAPRAVWIETSHRPQCLLSASNRRQDIDSLRGRTVAAFCGIGNPAGFRQTLTRLGYDVRAIRQFEDHHHYTRSDIEQLTAWAASQDVAAVLCTHKDLVKLGIDTLGKAPLWAVAVELEIRRGLSDLEAALAGSLAPAGG